MLGNWHGNEDLIDHLHRGRADAVSPSAEPFGAPRAVFAFWWDIGIIGPVLIHRGRIAQEVTAQPLGLKIDFQGLGRDPQVDGGADVFERDGVEVRLLRHVAVSGDLASVDPVADLVWHHWERTQQWLLFLAENTLAGAGSLLEGLRVIGFCLPIDGRTQGIKRGELFMA